VVGGPGSGPHKPQPGVSRVVDLGTGLHEVYYRVAAPGMYEVSVSLVVDAESGGAPERLPLRGSPFVVRAEDSMGRPRVLGTPPSAGETLAVGVVAGGDSSGPTIVAIGGPDVTESEGVTSVAVLRIKNAAPAAADGEGADGKAGVDGPPEWTWEREPVRTAADGAPVTARGATLAQLGSSSLMMVHGQASLTCLFVSICRCPFL